MKSLNNFLVNKNIENYSKHAYFPKTIADLANIIDKHVKAEGNDCDLNDIDVSEITDMSWLFAMFHEFNGDISKWDVSNVKNMCGMFNDSEFNGDISNWNVMNAEKMNQMFENSKFNNDISGWNVSKVTTMESMFKKSVFDKDISKWNVENVENMNSMFAFSKFNHDISSWNVEKVKFHNNFDMNSILKHYSKFIPKFK